MNKGKKKYYFVMAKSANKKDGFRSVKVEERLLDNLEDAANHARQLLQEYEDYNRVVITDNRVEYNVIFERDGQG